MEIIILVVACAVSFGAGMACYRYMLKRDPVKLEEWAKEAKRHGDRFKNGL